MAPSPLGSATANYNIESIANAHSGIYYYPYTLWATTPNTADPIAKTSFHYWVMTVIPKCKKCFKAKGLYPTTILVLLLIFKFCLC